VKTVQSFWNAFKIFGGKQKKSSDILSKGTLGQRSWDAADKQKAGWVSPSYKQSRTARLNPFVVAENRCIGALPSTPDIEAYKLLRTHILQRTEQEGGKTVMITSPLPGEGKTTTAINLAFTFAREFKQTVLLVDCDFRYQRIHEFLGIQSEKGLVNYLLNNESISDLIIWPGFEKLTLISGGKTTEDSAELLGSPRMQDVVQDMKSRYPDRYVFFDVPAILTSADAMAFMPYVDYILMVVSAGSTPLPEIQRALQLIPSEKMLGLVLNKNTGRQ
jgi:non-specific protein-tyrosine kinase